MQYFEVVYVWQLYVEQDDVGSQCGGYLQFQGIVWCVIQCDIFLLCEYLFDEQDVDGVVFDVEDLFVWVVVFMFCCDWCFWC